MLICNISMRARRSIVGDLVETAAAHDAASGLFVLSMLVDDPASARDTVSAYVGEIMEEAASADTALSAGMVFAVALVEAGAASATSGDAGAIAPAIRFTGLRERLFEPNGAFVIEG